MQASSQPPASPVHASDASNDRDDSEVRRAEAAVLEIADADPDTEPIGVEAARAEVDAAAPEIDLEPAEPVSPPAAEIPEEAIRVESSLPVPAEPAPRQSPQQGFWRRLALRRSEKRARAESDSQAVSSTAARVETIEGQVSAIEDLLEERFEQVEQRFTQFWEMEEQQGQILGRLDQIREVQEELQREARSTRRTVQLSAVISVVLLLAAIGAVAAWVAGATT